MQAVEQRGFALVRYELLTGQTKAHGLVFKTRANNSGFEVDETAFLELRIKQDGDPPSPDVSKLRGGVKAFVLKSEVLL